ncbi:uncharacterized protein LOC125177863 [Hyalella azteca]|uniref:Uncharacterized protein LOC125177863 n=1 Tax=Hyalella azteca TaxID=294128 RepID=A0A979FHZ5_HYAAZ|nr:uncharacterized protein LOC125177863 [Hyalella azteca]
MSANNACCVIRYTAVGKAAVVLTSIVSVYAFLQVPMEQNWCKRSEWPTFLLLVISLSSGYAAGVLYYGVRKERPNLLKVHSCMCVAISPLCLLTEVYSRHSETCSPNVVGMTISFLLLLLLAGIVWRCHLIMVN